MFFKKPDESISNKINKKVQDILTDMTIMESTGISFLTASNTLSKNKTVLDIDEFKSNMVFYREIMQSITEVWSDETINFNDLLAQLEQVSGRLRVTSASYRYKGTPCAEMALFLSQCSDTQSKITKLLAVLKTFSNYEANIEASADTASHP